MSQFLLIFLVLLSGWLPQSWAVGDTTAAMPGTEMQTAEAVKPDTKLCDKPKEPTDERGGQEVKSAKAAQAKCELTQLEAATAPEAAMKNFNRDKLENLNTVGMEQGRVLGQSGKMGEKAYFNWLEKADVTQKMENSYQQALNVGMKQGKQDLQNPQLLYQQAATQLGAAGQKFSAADRAKLQAHARKRAEEEIGQTRLSQAAITDKARGKTGATTQGSYFAETAAQPAVRVAVNPGRGTMSPQQVADLQNGAAVPKNMASGFTNLADARQRAEQGATPQSSFFAQTGFNKNPQFASQGFVKDEKGLGQFSVVKNVVTNKSAGVQIGNTSPNDTKFSLGAVTVSKHNTNNNEVNRALMTDTMADAKARQGFSYDKGMLGKYQVAQVNKVSVPDDSALFSGNRMYHSSSPLSGGTLAGESAMHKVQMKSLSQQEVKAFNDRYNPAVAVVGGSGTGVNGELRRGKKGIGCKGVGCVTAEMTVGKGGVKSINYTDGSRIVSMQEARATTFTPAGPEKTSSLDGGLNRGYVVPAGMKGKVTSSGLQTANMMNDFGLAVGAQKAVRQRVVATAMHESNFSPVATPQISSAWNYGQYLGGTWLQQHPDLNRNDSFDMTSALYKDIGKRYDQFSSSSKLQNRFGGDFGAYDYSIHYAGSLKAPEFRLAEAWKYYNSTKARGENLFSYVAGSDKATQGSVVVAGVPSFGEGRNDGVARVTVNELTREAVSQARPVLSATENGKKVLALLQSGQGYAAGNTSFASQNNGWTALLNGMLGENGQTSRSSKQDSSGKELRVADSVPLQDLRALDYLMLTGDIPLTPDMPLVRAGNDPLTAAQCASDVRDCVVQ